MATYVYILDSHNHRLAKSKIQSIELYNRPSITLHNNIDIFSEVESEEQGMRDVSDVLTVSFDNSVEDEPALCVARKIGSKITVLKMELGEQADILYHLLTEQTTKAAIRVESEDKND